MFLLLCYYNYMKYDFARIFETACGALGVDSAAVNVNVSFVSVRVIRDLNRVHRGVDKPTDVLSFPTLDISAGELPTRDVFPLDVNPESGKLELGDIVICPRVAREQARAIGQSFEREVVFLYLHGLLHLLGYDHMNENDEKEMLAKQRVIMRKLEGIL